MNAEKADGSTLMKVEKINVEEVDSRCREVGRVDANEGGQNLTEAKRRHRKGRQVDVDEGGQKSNANQA